MHEGVQDLLTDIGKELESLEDAGLYKHERVIAGPQNTEIDVIAGHHKDVSENGTESTHVINFCANNYLGLADDPRIIEAAKSALDTHGAGMASVRFICGTQDLHRALEKKIADYLGFDDAILYAACFDANGGLFEPIFGPEDAIISDVLIHASLIDGIRLTKARKYRYQNCDMADLEAKLQQAAAEGARRRVIVTDGVFSMDGYIAPLNEICALAKRYDALVMVDDCHATGVLGQRGRGTAEHCGVEGHVDIITGTFGKALGGTMGGFTVSHQPVIDILRQRSRPYLFSNSLAPALVAASIEAIDLSSKGDDLRARMDENAQRFRSGMSSAGFTLLEGSHPIIPVMIGDAALARKMADRLMDEGIYVTAFSYPVVPKGQARIRTQMSAAHRFDQIDRSIASFTKVGRDLGILKS